MYATIVISVLTQVMLTVLFPIFDRSYCPPTVSIIWINIDTTTKLFVGRDHSPTTVISIDFNEMGILVYMRFEDFLKFEIDFVYPHKAVAKQHISDMLPKC